MSIRSGRVVKAYQRQYDDPIQAKNGEVVRVTKRDLWNDRYLWLWCITASGKEGWTPESFIMLTDEQGVMLCDYSAIELTVSIGDDVTIIEEVGGWYWARKVTNEYGWVPVECVALDLM